MEGDGPIFPLCPGLLGRWEGLSPWGLPEVVSSVLPPSSYCSQGSGRGGWAPRAEHWPSKLWGLCLSTESRAGWLPPSPRVAGSPDFKACSKHIVGPGPGPQNQAAHVGALLCGPRQVTRPVCAPVSSFVKRQQSYRSTLP